MNVELKNLEKSNTFDQNKLNEATNSKSKGESELKTCVAFCKFKPNCEDAIPYFNQAAELFHGAGNWKEEISCREKLIFCFRNLKSEWEEGNQHEKIAELYLHQLEDNKSTLISVQNAYQSFFIHGDYKDAVNTVKKLGHQFYEKDEIDEAERCLRIAYDAFLQVFHVLATKKEESYEYLYSALDEYINILYRNNKVRIAIDALENIIKIIDQYEDNKSRVIHVYGFLLLSLIVNEDESIFTSRSEAAKIVSPKSSDYRFIENIINLNENIKEGREDRFRDCMIEVNIDYPNEICKKLNNLFMDRKEKLKNVVADIPVIINNYKKEREKESINENLNNLKNDGSINNLNNNPSSPIMRGGQTSNQDFGDDGLIVVVDEDRNDERNDYL